MTTNVHVENQTLFRVVTSYSGAQLPAEHVVQFSRSAIGGDDLRWRDKVRNATNATNGYTLQKRRIYAPITAASTHYIPTDRVLLHYGNYFYSIGFSPTYRFPVHDSTLTSKVRALAEAKFIARAREALSSFEGGAFLGELGSTLRGLRHPLAAIRRGLPSAARDIRRSFRDRGKAISPGSSGYKKASKVAAQTWLEYAFGWTPLFADVSDLCHTLSRPLLITQRVSSGIVTLLDNKVGGSEYVSQGASVQFRGASHLHCKYSARVKGVVGFDTSPARRQLKDFGLTRDSFLPTAWEVLPWSWLVDYFTNVGDIVNAVSFNRAYLRWVSNVAIFDGKRTIYMKGESSNNNYKLLNAGPYTNSWHEFRLSRTANVAFAPELTFDCALKARQGVNAISALITRLR